MATRLYPFPKRAVSKQNNMTRAVTCRHLTTVRASSSRINSSTPAFPTGTATTRPGSDEDVYACRLTPEYYRRYRDPSSHDRVPQPVFSSSNSSTRSSPLPPISSFAAESSRTSISSKDKQKGLAEFEQAWSKLPSSGGGDDSGSRSNSTSTSTRHRKSALLFPGSGSQYVGMTSFLLDNFKTAREIWEEAEDSLAEFEKWRKDLKLHELPELKHLELLDWPTWQKERHQKELRQVVLAGPQDELTRSSNAQPAILISSIALLRVLEKEFGVKASEEASFFAGHSSGEYSACVASGAITFAEGVKLTRLHGLLTSRTLQLSSLKSYSEYDATDEERAQMSAVVVQGNHTHQDVLNEVKKVRETYKGQGNSGMCEIASWNSSTQVVLSGSRAGVLKACEVLQDKGVASRAADLPVFAPFHCSFMSLASIGMTHAWEHGVSAHAPTKPMISNVDATPITDTAKLKRDIVASVHKPVCWSAGIDLMQKEGVDRFIFIGPGKALANLAKKDLQPSQYASSSNALPSLYQRQRRSEERSHTENTGEPEILSVATLNDFREVQKKILGTVTNNGPALSPRQARALA